MEKTLLVTRKNSQNLAEALIKLLTEGALRNKLSRKFRVKSEKHSWIKVAQISKGIYQSVLNA